MGWPPPFAMLMTVKAVKIATDIDKRMRESRP